MRASLAQHFLEAGGQEMAVKTTSNKDSGKKAQVKKPVLTRAKNSALEQIDQVLLGFQHSSLAKFSAKLKAADTGDLLMMVGRKVLEQAEAIRKTIPESSQAAKTPQAGRS